tara:strand:+ start:2383 stop:2685 length:303 start_codon:yes stop_codon:yes gene_type:complete
MTNAKRRMLSIMAMAMMMDPKPYNIQEAPESTGNRLKIHSANIGSCLDFNKQEGVLNMIKDYNLIQKGESKKGSKKKFRIKKQVEQWLEKGWLNNDDLKK